MFTIWMFAALAVLGPAPTSFGVDEVAHRPVSQAVLAATADTTPGTPDPTAPLTIPESLPDQIVIAPAPVATAPLTIPESLPDQVVIAPAPETVVAQGSDQSGPGALAWVTAVVLGVLLVGALMLWAVRRRQPRDGR